MKETRHDTLEQLPTEQGSRFYKTHTGLKVPSVTTILNVVGKPALVPWAANKEREMTLAAVQATYAEISAVMQDFPEPEMFMDMVAESMAKTKAYQQELRKAGSIGTNVHNRIEWEFNQELTQTDEPIVELESPEAERSFERAVDWRKSTKLKVLGTERKVISLHGRYAGTLDALVRCEGKVGVIDFKTGKRVYEEAFLQNCAYRLALAEEGIKTQAGWIILLPKTEDDSPFEVVEVPPMEELIEPWMSAVALHRWLAERKAN